LSLSADSDQTIIKREVDRLGDFFAFRTGTAKTPRQDVLPHGERLARVLNPDDIEQEMIGGYRQALSLRDVIGAEFAGLQAGGRLRPKTEPPSIRGADRRQPPTHNATQRSSWRNQLLKIRHVTITTSPKPFASSPSNRRLGGGEAVRVN